MAGPADATPVVEAQKRAPAEYKAVADFLRGKNGPKVRRGILNGKRVDYFKGKTAIRTLLGPAYQKLKKVPPLKDEEEAKELMMKILPHAFFLRTDRPDLDPPPPAGTPKTLLLAPQQSFDSLAHYTWFYEGSPLATILGGIGMVAVIFAGVLFPLWPIQLRVGVWYLSILALCAVGALIVLAIVRLIFWCGTVLLRKKAIWIFPNLFEDVGFIDSFIPLWAYDEPKKKKKRPAGTKPKSKKSKTAESTAGELAGEEAQGDGNGDVGPTAGSSTAVEGAMGNVKRRQAATIEEIDDDEA